MLKFSMATVGADTERWERLPGGAAADGTVLALRAAPECARDSFIVIAGDHFSYIRARKVITQLCCTADVPSFPIPSASAGQ